MRSAPSDGPLDFVRPGRAVAMRLIAGRGHYETVLDAVMNASLSVWIATANLKELMVEDWRARPGKSRSGRPDYQSILARFEELAARGVELRILHATLPSRPFRAEFDKREALIKGGLELRMCPRVHLKTVIVDGRFCYLGSANWTGAGLGAKGTGRRNFELGFVSEDELLLDDVQALYDRLWRGVECKSCNLTEECGAPLDGSRIVQLGRRRPAKPARPARRARARTQASRAKIPAITDLTSSVPAKSTGAR